MPNDDPQTTSDLSDTDSEYEDEYDPLSTEFEDKDVDLSKIDFEVDSLNLSRRNIDDDGARYLADILKDNYYLRRLILTENNITAKGAKFLADTLKENNWLRKLVLWGNEIGLLGARSFADALPENQSLTVLDLGSNNICSLGASSLADALEKNYSLTELILSGFSINPDIQLRIESLLTRNKEIDSIRETILANRSHVKSMLAQKIPTEIVNANLQHMSDMLEKLKGFTIQNEAVVKDEITSLEEILNDLVIQAHLHAGDLKSALLRYDIPHTPQSAFLLAEYLFIEHLPTVENRGNILRAALALFREVWKLPEAEQLTTKAAYSLCNLGKTTGSVGVNSQTVLGVEKIIPLNIIEKNILIEVSSTTGLSDDDKRNWTLIAKHLSILSPDTLYQLCQLPPLSNALRKDLNTTQVTSFFHLCNYQNQYPLSSETTEIKLLDLSAEVKRSLQANAAESRAQGKKWPLKKEDNLQDALDSLIKPLRIKAAEQITKKETASQQAYQTLLDRVKHRLRKEEAPVLSNSRYHILLNQMRKDYFEGKLTDMTLPKSSQPYHKLLCEKLGRIEEDYNKMMSYADDYQFCVTLANFFFEEKAEQKHRKKEPFTLFSRSTKSTNYEKLVTFMKEIETEGFLKKILSQETHTFSHKLAR